jgi:hypothetical protein
MSNPHNNAKLMMKRCNYKDYRSANPLALPDHMLKRHGPRGGVKISFTKKLHSLLEENLDPDVISWQPHGRSFVIHNPKEFLSEVMPKYFMQSKLTSFQRQLNLYGFTRIMAPGPDKGSHYHELFLRGKNELVPHVVRMRLKGSDGRIPVDLFTEPNFFNLPFLPTSEVVSSSTQRGSKKKKTEPQKSSLLKQREKSRSVRSDSWSNPKLSPRHLQHRSDYHHHPKSPSDVTSYRCAEHTTDIQSYFAEAPHCHTAKREGYLHDWTTMTSRVNLTFQEPPMNQSIFRPDRYRPKIRLSTRRHYGGSSLYSTEEALILEAQEELIADPSCLNFDCDPSMIFE